MAKFGRKGKNNSPGISTASLPDIVFMLLFFFMVSTVLREVDLKVKVNQPDAMEIQKIENKSLVDHIYIGAPVESEKYGTEPMIQLNDDFATLNDIQPFIVAGRENRPEAVANKVTTSLKVDRDTKMGVVTDVKQELRKIYALKVNYSTHQAAVK